MHILTLSSLLQHDDAHLLYLFYLDWYEIVLNIFASCIGFKKYLDRFLGLRVFHQRRIRRIHDIRSVQNAVRVVQRGIRTAGKDGIGQTCIGSNGVLVAGPIWF